MTTRRRTVPKMKGLMRASSKEKEKDVLLKQNAMMAVEITRLRGQVTSLKQYNRTLIVSSLKLPENTRDACAQTDNGEATKTSDDNPVKKVLAQFPTKDSVEYNPLLRDKLNSRSSLTLSTDEFVDYKDAFPTPEHVKGSPRKHLSPRMALSPRMLNSPKCKKKIFHGISDRIVRALYPTAGRSPLKHELDTPSVPLSPDAMQSSPEAFKPDHKEVTSDDNEHITKPESPAPLLDRTPRRVRKPTTYKEPSLKVKVRRSFKFVQYQDPPAENFKQELANVPEDETEA